MVKHLKIRYETCLNMSKHVQWWQKDCNECLSRGTGCLPSLSKKKKINERVEKSFQFSDKVVIKRDFVNMIYFVDFHIVIRISHYIFSTSLSSL